ncbi:sensor histidine kinase [Nonomuraea fuscirosea]|uniref:sensor histidine kinase n=1 Tax=Nonomuraea fuscirosea TaxID=1291556 RepID=UPI00342F9564
MATAPALAPDSRRTRARHVAVALSGVAGVEVVVAVVGSMIAGRGWQEALDSFVVTNATMGLAFSACGLVIAWHRRSNPIGWLLIADGLGHGTTSAVVPLIRYGQDAAWPDTVVGTLATVGAYAWPWSIALFLPLSLQLFPDGRAAGPVLRRLMWVTVATAPLFVLEMGAGSEALVTGVRGYLTLPGYADLAPLWAVSEARTVIAVVIGLVALVIRYRHGDETRRRQLLWLVQAALIVAAVLAVWSAFPTLPVLLLLAVPLIPVAISVAILRHHLLDIRLVFSRTVLYALLTGAVVAAYLVLVAALDSVMRRQVGLGSSVAATVLIAIGFNPVRVRLQRGVDRVLYGDRADPMRAVSRVGRRLDAGLPGVLEAVREALRIPYAALHLVPGEQTEGGDAVTVVASGRPPQLLHTFPLRYDSAPVGDLVVGLRPGEKRLDRADRAVLELLAAPLSVALHATTLSDRVQHSREAIVVAREEERRRLRRDLHDGLGPVLTGVTFKADAAGNLLAADPAAARLLLAELRAETARAISDVRRLIYDLRPPALDDLGLAGAIRQRATHLERDGVAVHLEVPGTLPPMSAAVEAAAFRIAVEAMNNAVRHSAASHIDVLIEADAQLHLRIRDNGGSPQGRDWKAGVGLLSMRERAAELGGSCTAGPRPEGGLVVAVLPLGAS